MLILSSVDGSTVSKCRNPIRHHLYVCLTVAWVFPMESRSRYFRSWICGSPYGQLVMHINAFDSELLKLYSYNFFFLIIYADLSNLLLFMVIAIMSG